MTTVNPRLHVRLLEVAGDPLGFISAATTLPCMTDVHVPPGRSLRRKGVKRDWNLRCDVSMSYDVQTYEYILYLNCEPILPGMLELKCFCRALGTEAPHGRDSSAEHSCSGRCVKPLHHGSVSQHSTSMTLCLVKGCSFGRRVAS